jgi:hypothetical protein
MAASSVWHDPGGARLAIDAPAHDQDCGIVGRSRLLADLRAMGVSAAAHRGRERAEGIPAAYLDLAAVAAVFATPALYLGLVYFRE